MAVPLTAYKIQGQTSGGAAINTVDIDIDISGQPRLKVSGRPPVPLVDDAAINQLFDLLFNVQFLGK